MKNPMNYRIDNIPKFLFPAFVFYNLVLALPILAVVYLLRLTCKKEEVNREVLRRYPSHILVYWHHAIFPAIIGVRFRNHRYSTINHPAWYMGPILLVLRVLGIEKLVYGSTGNRGRKAADMIVADLNEGFSTIINPDGPSGPPESLKKGVLHIAHQSKKPMIPVKITTPKSIALPTWDKKRAPLPFTSYTVRYSEPIFVTEEDFDSAAEALVKQL